MLIKTLSLVLFFIVYVNSILADEVWDLQRSNFYFENDIFLQKDAQYTSGWKLSNVYYLPEKSTLLQPSFLSLGIAQQIYTPQDLNQSELIVDDRPYAGWLYLELGYHQSSEYSLDSFSIQLGIVGKLSGAQAVQQIFHTITDSNAPKGWNNQLNNELGINLIYQHKWRYISENILGLKSSFIPFTTLSLGNVNTHINGGFLIRLGLNPIQDFGSSSIDIGGENGIPVRSNCLCKEHENWTYTLNASTKAEVVLRDIFLDGNTFSDSHSVDKENLLYYYSFGFTLRYKHFSFDYILNSSSKHFKKATSSYKFGTVVFSYLY